MMIPYINIHTHQFRRREYTEVVNLFPQHAEEKIGANPHSFFSVGLHPWYIDENSAWQLKQIEKLAACRNVVAVGETGLDKLSRTDFSEQIKIFKAQVTIAEKVQKPLIIHCVKAYREILSLKKELHVDVPLIFHAFRGKPELAKELVHQNCFLSVGEKAARIPETIQTIPPDRLFIETDDSEAPIEEIYQTIAGIKEIRLQDLAKQIQINFNQLFH